MIPQIIYLVLSLISLVMIGNKHGKPKEGNHNAYADIITMIIAFLLLWWGGFFDPILN